MTAIAGSGCKAARPAICHPQKTKLSLHYSRQRLRVIWPQNRAVIRLSETLKYHRYVGNLAELRRFRERLSY